MSGSLLGPDALSEISSALGMAPIRVRDDVDMMSEDIAGVQVDAKVDANPAQSGDATPLDPPSDLAFSATVVRGTAMGTVQVSDLPPGAQRQVDKAVRRAVVGRKVTRLDGSGVTLDGVSDIRTILTLKVHPGGYPDWPAIGATKISRTYDAELKIDSPPAYLVRAVRDADRAGKQVTAHVDLRTGTRPIAFILLKKS